MILPRLPKCEPEAVGLDSKALKTHSVANRRHVRDGFYTGIAECVLKDNKIVFSDFHGHQDIEKKKPMTANSLHRCYSMTKPITAFGFLSLWEEGKLRLDDPVSKYIPEFRNMKVFTKSNAFRAGPRGGGVVDAQRPITLRNLVTHTSGIGYGPTRNDRSEEFPHSENPIKKQYMDFVLRVESGAISSLKAFCQELAKQPLRFEPGEQWEYGHSMDVIGRVCEVVSGLPLDRFLRERVFRPIGMRDTAFFISPRKASRQLAASYLLRKRRSQKRPYRVRCDGKQAEKSFFVKGRGARIFAGGGFAGSCDGGLTSSVRDQALFANVIANKGFAHATRRQVLKPATVAMATRDWLKLSSVTTNYPLKGWHEKSDKTSFNRGWAPFGITEASNIFMGGIGSWQVELRKKIVMVTFPNAVWEGIEVPGWKEDVDEIEGVTAKAAADFQANDKLRKAAQASRKRTVGDSRVKRTQKRRKLV